MVTFKKTDFTMFQKWINKFPCKARLKGWGEGSSGVLAISPRNRLRPDVPEISGGRDKHGYIMTFSSHWKLKESQRE